MMPPNLMMLQRVDQALRRRRNDDAIDALGKLAFDLRREIMLAHLKHVVATELQRPPRTEPARAVCRPPIR